MRGMLARMASAKGLGETQRRASLDALMSTSPQENLALLSTILNDSTELPALRDHVARQLAGTNRAEFRAELLKSLAIAPARLQSVIAAGLASSRQGAEALLEAVATGKASPRLLQEPAVQIRLMRNDAFKERLVKLTEGLPPADSRLQALLQQRRSGYRRAKPDLALGITTFEKHCANCHQLGGKGAKVGPQLDGIGIRGVERLLEDIVDPNRNVDQAFRSTTLNLKNGQLVSGLVLREEGEVIVLANNEGKEVRIPKGQVEERTVSQLSPMPATLVDQIPEVDFYNMLAYLLSQRPAPVTDQGK
jgi:putative heme-binding domain-containing protein